MYICISSDERVLSGHLEIYRFDATEKREIPLDSGCPSLDDRVVILLSVKKKHSDRQLFVVFELGRLSTLNLTTVLYRYLNYTNVSHSSNPLLLYLQDRLDSSENRNNV